MTTAHAAYARRRTAALGGRGAEGEALAKAARLLDDSRRHPGDRTRLVRALRFNQTLWTVFQADLSTPGNRLPGALKAKVLSLSLFMDRETVAQLRHPDPAALQPMIDVNRSLAAALLGH